MRAHAHAFAERVLVMAQGYDKSLGMIAKILRAQSNQVPLEPLPERWVDLIHHLNERERGRSRPRQPEAEPRERPQRVN